MKIAFSGIAGSGKDYFSSFLVEEHGFTRFSFSDQLKKLSTLIFDWIEEDYPPESKEKPLNITTSLGEKITKTPREIWLTFNFLRDVESKVFIRRLKEQLDKSKVEKRLISDMRTKDEFEFAKSEGYVTILIKPDKSKVIHKENDFDKQIKEFEDKFDYIFYNDFSGTSKFENFIKDILK
jgi:adenylate kinase family enzyme